MSRTRSNRRPVPPPHLLFAALGDATRLALLARLSAGQPCSISELTQHSRLTRQAITKHLDVLARAGFVRCTPSGREKLYRFQPRPIQEMHEYLEEVSRQWDQALARLKAMVE